ncbi:hypothetical protein GCM10020219_039520 [Nonomuraea dietziae]
MDVKNDYVRTHVTRDPDLGVLAGIFAELEGQAVAALEREGFTSPVCRRSADLRYYGQAYEVRVAAPPGPLGEEWRAEVLARFHDEAHERLYGYAYRDDPRHAVEWVNLRVSGIGPITPARHPRAPRTRRSRPHRAGRAARLLRRARGLDRAPRPPARRPAQGRRGQRPCRDRGVRLHPAAAPPVSPPSATRTATSSSAGTARAKPGTSTSTKGQSR